MTASMVFGLRIAAGVAVLILGFMAMDRSTSTVTASFPAAETAGLSADVVVECASPKSLDDSPGGTIIAGANAYSLWIDAAAEKNGTVSDSAAVQAVACDAARDARLITVIWLVAGMLAAALVVVAFTRIHVRDS